MSIQTQVHRTPNRQDQKKKTPMHIIVKTLSTYNKKHVLKTSREENASHM